MIAPQLKPFQYAGAQFLAERTRALLACEPGTGKSAQAITAANLIRARHLGVVCPSIAVEHWHREFKRWSLQGKGEVISWDDAHKRAASLAPGEMRWDALVLDEVHLGKNPQARRTKAVFAKGGIGWHARRIWAMSGTPAPNNLAELWPLLRAFGKTKMDFETFTNHFCIVDAMGKIRGNRPERVEELRVILKSIALRRTKKDVLPELGEISLQDWFVKPDVRFALERGVPLADFPKAERQETELQRRLKGLSDDEILAFLSDPTEDFATLRRYNALLKAPAVFDTVQFELANGLLDKVVIYGYHKDALAHLHLEFGRHNIGSVLIYGDTPVRERDGLIEHWKHSAHVPVFIGSLVIASTAIDLTAAHQGILLEVDWVPGVNAQAVQRMHRHGQENPVTVRVAHGTPIDEIVNGVVMRKTKDLAELFS